MTQNPDLNPHTRQREARIKMAQALLNMNALAEEMGNYSLPALQKAAAAGYSQDLRVKYAALTTQHVIEKQAFLGALLRAGAKYGGKGLGMARKALGYGAKAAPKVAQKPRFVPKPVGHHPGNFSGSNIPDSAMSTLGPPQPHVSSAMRAAKATGKKALGGGLLAGGAAAGISGHDQAPAAPSIGARNSHTNAPAVPAQNIGGAVAGGAANLGLGKSGSARNLNRQRFEKQAILGALLKGGLKAGKRLFGVAKPGAVSAASKAAPVAAKVAPAAASVAAKAAPAAASVAAKVAPKSGLGALVSKGLASAKPAARVAVPAAAAGGIGYGVGNHQGFASGDATGYDRGSLEGGNVATHNLFRGLMDLQARGAKSKTDIRRVLPPVKEKKGSARLSKAEWQRLNVKLASTASNIHALDQEMARYSVAGLQKSAGTRTHQVQRVNYAALACRREIEKQALWGAVGKGLMAGGRMLGKGLMGGAGAARKGVGLAAKGIEKAAPVAGRAAQSVGRGAATAAQSVGRGAGATAQSIGRGAGATAKGIGGMAAGAGRAAAPHLGAAAQQVGMAGKAGVRGLGTAIKANPIGSAAGAGALGTAAGMYGGQAAGHLGGMAQAGMQGVGGYLNQGANSVGNSIGQGANSLGNSIGQGANSIGNSIGQGANALYQGVTAPGRAVGDAVGSGYGAVRNFLGDAGKAVGDVQGGLGKAVGDVQDGFAQAGRRF